MSNIAWVDVETDGLDYFRGGHLLEIACVITDEDLNNLPGQDRYEGFPPVEGVGFHAVVAYTAERVGIMAESAPEVVREMHAKTGLWQKLYGPEAMRIGWIDAGLTEYLARFGGPGTIPVGGNSIRLDLNFIEDALPVSYGYLHYQMRDVTSLAKFAQSWLGVPPFEKVGSHTAMGDILESIAEARYYKAVAFKSERTLRQIENAQNDMGLTMVDYYNRAAAHARKAVGI